MVSIRKWKLSLWSMRIPRSLTETVPEILILLIFNNILMLSKNITWNFYSFSTIDYQSDTMSVLCFSFIVIKSREILEVYKLFSSAKLHMSVCTIKEVNQLRKY